MRRATVLPPVLGPVITSARTSSPNRMSIGTTRPVSPGWRADRSSTSSVVTRLWADGAQLVAQPRPCDPEVERRQDGERLVERVGLSLDERRQLVEDALLLCLDRQLRLAPGVAQLDHDEWLDEDRLATPRLVVDDALDAPALVGADRDDVAAVAQGDQRLLQDAGELGTVDERLESRPQPLVGDADRAAEPTQRG